MKCPTCGVDLLMTERQGVEIDYCSQCRGVWLDRGELDKILERSAAEYAGSAQAPTQAVRHDRPVESNDHHREASWGRPEHGKGGHKRKKSSFLTDIFEGFGD
jgi:Zn-finger nucleic acid-binding protein